MPTTNARGNLERMIKVVLKEPVGGMIQGGISARATNYLLCKGGFDYTRLREDAKWFVFVDIYNNMVYIPVGNVAFIQEVSDDPALHKG